MTKIRAIIVDDEKNAAEVIQAQLERFFPDIDVLQLIHDSSEAISVIATMKPDLLFLDINMPILDGFQLLESLPNRSFETVFITAYDNYALKAFQENAIGYILKPIDKKEFIKTVAVAILRINNESIRSINSKEILSTTEFKIALPCKDEQVIISINHIYYVQASGSYSEFYTCNGNFLISKNLSHVSNNLLENRFVRANRSFLINPQQIKSFTKKDGGSVKMTNEFEISISSKNKTDVFEHLSEIINMT